MDAVGFSPRRALLLRARVPFHLAFRWTCRFWIATDKPRSGRAPLRLAAVAGCALWDVAEAVRLARDPRLRLGRRLPADLVDVAAWSAACGTAHPVVPILGIPLVAETALRYQLAAAPVVGAHLAAATAARTLAGKSPAVASMGHQVLATLFGLGLRRVERSGAERVGAAFEAERRAMETAGTIAGQYRVARSDYLVGGRRVNPHDVLSGVRLHFPSARDRPTALHDLTWGGRKGALEALASEGAVQLDTALRAWKRHANHRRTALADQVLGIDLPEGQGMTLLSGDQVAQLGRALDSSGARGQLGARVLEATRPGARVVIEVDGARVVLTADPLRMSVVRADPTPVAMVEGGVLWALLEATPAADAAPAWSVVPGVLAFASLAAWSRRAVRERGEAAYPSMVQLSAGAALVQAATVHLATRGRPDRPDGSQRFPMQAALNAPAVVAGFCWPSLPARHRWQAAVAMAALATIGVALLERPRWRLDLVRNGLWLPALFVPALAYSLGGLREVERARAELHTLQAAAADDAARRGERSEWERVRDACTEGLEEIGSVAPPARPAVESRLRDLLALARRQLDELGDAAGEHAR